MWSVKGSTERLYEEHWLLADTSPGVAYSSLQVVLHFTSLLCMRAKGGGIQAMLMATLWFEQMISDGHAIMEGKNLSYIKRGEKTGFVLLLGRGNWCMRKNYKNLYFLNDRWYKSSSTCRYISENVGSLAQQKLLEFLFMIERNIFCNYIN